jgi:calcium-binding protein CML
MVSRSDPSSFSSGTTSSSTSSTSLTNNKPDSGDAPVNFGTPTSVLPDISSDIYFELAHAFKLIDQDNDGFVPRTELEKLLTQLGPEQPSQEEVRLVLSELDVDGDGVISQEALLSRVMGCNEPACDTELRKAFEIFDADGDGKISAEDLFNFFTALGDEGCTLEDCLHMIAGVDDNGDGFVCFEEFLRMMELQR